MPTKHNCTLVEERNNNMSETKTKFKNDQYNKVYVHKQNWQQKQ